MTRAQKQKFRMSEKWKRFRLKMKRKYNGVDFITKHPLTKTWNLHHLDMRDTNYTNIDDTSRFMPLNESTHEHIHYLYRLWIKDKSIIDRMVHVLNMMEVCTHDKPIEKSQKQEELFDETEED